MRDMAIHASAVRRISAIKDLAPPVHLALGVFDGVHLGHQAVISRAVLAARKEGGEAGVLTFDPYPLRVLAPEKAPRRLLASLDHKATILEPFGVDFLLAIPFDRQRACLPAEDFVRELVNAGARTIAAGEDWRFGHNRTGDRNLLSQLSEKLGFSFQAVPPVMMDGERISSTRIRQAVRDGNLQAAARMLGRPYSVMGKVLEGRKLGRELGFPTANIQPGDEQFPPDGVWAVQVKFGPKCFQGVANLGKQPTVNGTDRTLEVHLFDFHDVLYNQVIEVFFLNFIRPVMKFDSISELKAQIQSDCTAAETFLAQLGDHPEETG